MLNRIPIQELSHLASGRAADPFLDEIRSRGDDVAGRVRGKRFLVIGGAGSIGSATGRALLSWQASAMHVVDQDENGLAEFVRDARSRGLVEASCDLRALPLDYGSQVMQHLVAVEGPYDAVLNFAAMKHVRSEKDRYSLAQMIDTNVLKHARLLAWLKDAGAARRYFYISTDKAANPANAMGATKRLGELLAMSKGLGPGAGACAVRFANVAYSHGSLLEGFVNRLDRRQPLAVPEGTRRFFVSLDQAAHICMLAALLGPAGLVLVPSASTSFAPRLLEDVAAEFLRAHGLEPHYYRDPAQARVAPEGDLLLGRYPVLLTPLDTTGEKPLEEFIADGERALDAGLSSLAGVAVPADHDEHLARCIDALDRAVPDAEADKDVLLELLASAVPTFRHSASGQTLDGRM